MKKENNSQLFDFFEELAKKSQTSESDFLQKVTSEDADTVLGRFYKVAWSKSL